MVILSRTAEMASAASHHGILRGAAAIELHAVGPAEAARYLERVQLDPPPGGWHDLIKRIRSAPTSPLSRALGSPLALTLVRDTYQSGDDVQGLLDFCDALAPGVDMPQAIETITDHLLDRVLPAAYACRPGQPPPRYDLPTAQNTLRIIAAHMNQDGTRDLQWWRIHAWVPSAQRFLIGGLAAGLAAALTAGLAVGPAIGLAVGLAAALAAGFLSLGGNSPLMIGRPRLRKVLTFESLELMVMVVCIFAFLGWIGPSVGPRLGEGLVAGIGVGLGPALGILLRTDPQSVSSLSPVTSRREDRKYGLVIGLAGITGVAAVGGLGAALGEVHLFDLVTMARIGTGREVLYAGGWVAVLMAVRGIAHGIRLAAGGKAIFVGVLMGVLVGILVAGSAGVFVALLMAILTAAFVVGLLVPTTWSASVAAIQIAIKWRTPVYLMSFLEDARSRNILRTVGSAYQFRHARLQDRLVTATTETLTIRPGQRPSRVRQG